MLFVDRMEANLPPAFDRIPRSAPVSGVGNLAHAIKGLSWAEMVKVSEYLAGEYSHMVTSDTLDRDGMAQVLNDMADEIIREASKDADREEPKTDV